MSSNGIVESFYVVEHVGARLVPASVCRFADTLGLEGREEALHRGIVPDVAGVIFHGIGTPLRG